MLTFEQAYAFTAQIGSHTSFEKEECEAYFETLMTIEKHNLVVEVGLEYGRSSSIALQVCRVKDLDYVGIDPFENEEVWESWIENLVGLSPAVYKHRSTEVLGIGAISALLIDGDHSYEGVAADIRHFEPNYMPGTYLMFHDYKRESLPDVTRAVDEYMAEHPVWNHVRTVGTLGIWRRA